MIVHSFLLIGQSNMAGRGFFNEAHEINSENIRVQRNGRWCSFTRPVVFDRAFSGVCLAESFAQEYSLKKGVITGLIPCADGGTKIDQWEKGSLLYDNAVNCAHLAQRTSTIAGVLWHQGESDTLPELCDVYEKKLETLFDNLRHDLGLYDVPFIVGSIGDYMQFYNNGERKTGYEKVNAQLKHYAQTHEMTGFVDTAGLPYHDDNLHFSASALYEIGIRYFNAFEKIEDKNKQFPDKPYDNVTVRSEMENL